MERFVLGASGVLAVAIIGVWIAALIGYVMNIVKLLSIVFDSFTGSEVEAIVRAVGILAAPLGAIAGWF